MATLPDLPPGVAEVIVNQNQENEIPHKSGAVRGYVESVVLFKPVSESETMLTYAIFLDPRGWIPKFGECPLITITMHMLIALTWYSLEKRR